MSEHADTGEEVTKLQSSSSMSVTNYKCPSANKKSKSLQMMNLH